MCPEMFSKARSRGLGSSEEGEGEGEVEGLMEDHEKPPSRKTGMPRSVPMAGLAVLVLVAWFSFGGSVRSPDRAATATSSRHACAASHPGLQAPERGVLRVATWNIAAINNNPFEYWITHEDADYNTLMEGVQSFIDQPGAFSRPRARLACGPGVPIRTRCDRLPPHTLAANAPATLPQHTLAAAAHAATGAHLHPVARLAATTYWASLVCCRARLVWPSPHPLRPGHCAGERDVPVSQVFTPEMWAELKALMAAQVLGY